MRTAPLKTGARLLAVPHAAVAHSAMQTTRMFEQQRIRVPRAPAPRMTVPRATSVDSYMPEPIEQAPSVERVEPQLGGAVGQIGSFAVKFVLDAFKMLQVRLKHTYALGTVISHWVLLYLTRIPPNVFHFTSDPSF